MSNLKVTTWDSLIGQEKVKNLIKMKIQAAQERGEQLDHCLILGSSGMGKTSLANLIAKEHRLAFLPIMVTPNFGAKDLHRIILGFSENGGGLIFFDEIHLLSRKDQHYLYSILEDGQVSHDNGDTTKLDHPLTIVCATTEPDMLTKPLKRRFESVFQLEDYTDQEMAEIVKRMALRMEIDLTINQAKVLGRASAGSPTQAKRLMTTARDLGTVHTKKILDICEVTSDGLTQEHLAYLSSLYNLGMKSGIKNIASHASRSIDEMLDMEKLLVRRQLIQITGNGRVLTTVGYKTLKDLKKEGVST